MKEFRFEALPIEGPRLIEPFYSEDDRGYFLKSFEKRIFEENGISMEPFETFESLSVKGVLRGMHFQTQLPQAKLIRAVTGKIFDAAVDLRNGSATFGKWCGVELSRENRLCFYIPPGFAHGFLVLSESALVSYLCAGEYLKEYDMGIRWDDKDIGIAWPMETIGIPRVSERDQRLPTLRRFRAATGGL